MQTNLTHDEVKRIPETRESFSCRLLTDPQFHEGLAIVSIMKHRIQTEDGFKKAFESFVETYSRTNNIEIMRAQTVLREMFKGITGQTMNQMREDLAKNAENLTDGQRQRCYDAACDIADMMEKGDKLTFHRACSHQAQQLATEFNITASAARRTMSEEFKAAEGIELYDWGKELDEQFYRPQIEAEKAEREKPAQGRTKTATRTRGPVRAGPR